MTKKLFFFSVLAIVSLSYGCSDLRSFGIESLTIKLHNQLKNREFEKIYDEASEHMHMNATRDEFIERAGKIVEELERVDKNINWSPNHVFNEPNKVTTYVTNTYFSSYKELGEGTQNISVFITWEQVPNDTPRLFDLSVDSHPNAERPFHLITAGKIDY